MTVTEDEALAVITQSLRADPSLATHPADAGMTKQLKAGRDDRLARSVLAALQAKGAQTALGVRRPSGNVVVAGDAWAQRVELEDGEHLVSRSSVLITSEWRNRD